MRSWLKRVIEEQSARWDNVWCFIVGHPKISIQCLTERPRHIGWMLIHVMCGWFYDRSNRASTTNKACLSDL